MRIELSAKIGREVTSYLSAQRILIFTVDGLAMMGAGELLETCTDKYCVMWDGAPIKIDIAHH